MTKEKLPLLGKTKQELKKIVEQLGGKPYVASQIAKWLYQNKVSSIAEMTNLSKKFREDLSAIYEVGFILPMSVSKSKDGTKKYLFKYAEHVFIESAYIPEKSRATLCISSQMGCKMACAFCATGKQGFGSHLTTHQIINQLLSIPEADKITNIVYMGMGEPLDNLNNVLESIEILTSEYGLAMSPKRITVSSIGMVNKLKVLAEKCSAHIAISLHSPFDDERATFMPIQKASPISEVVALLKTFDFNRQRRISFEYILFKDFNDTPKHVKGIVKLLHGLNARVNLIAFHEVDEVPFKKSSKETIQWFCDQLNAHGVKTTIRTSRGEDIEAACGLLSTKEIMSDE